ncbi:MAG: hypothetical protein Q9201_005494 [Fulgogasparrea decipioides]
MGWALSLLPVELLEQICERCDLKSICALRLSSSELNKKTLDLFTKRYFSSAHIDLSARSLRKLDQISLDEQFNTQVKTLFIDWSSNGCFGEGLNWSREENGRLKEVQMSAQPLIQILCYRMINCRSFYIRGGHDDGEKFDNLYSTDVASLVLSIVAQTGLRITSFVVHLHHQHSSNKIHASGSLCEKRLQPSTFLNPKFKDAWAHLKELHLYQDLDSETMSWTKDIMCLATNLRSLALAVHSSHSWLAPELLSAAAMHQVGRLQRIYLQNICASDLHLLNFLNHSRHTLQTLTFRRLTVMSRGGVGTLLRHLRKEFPELRSLSLLILRESPVSSPEGCWARTWIVFPTTLSEKLRSLVSSGDQVELTTRKKGIIGTDYTGTRMTKVLECLAELQSPFN